MPDVNIFYRKSSDFKMLPISGIWGGLTAQGYLYCELFFEKAETPESILIHVEEGKKPHEGGQRPETLMFVRESLVGLSMQPEIARAIGEWLIKNADQFKKKFVSEEK